MIFTETIRQRIQTYSVSVRVKSQNHNMGFPKSCLNWLKLKKILEIFLDNKHLFSSL